MNLFIEGERERVMMAAKEKGCECPVCGQFVKAYKRRVTSSAAAGLIWAHNRYGKHAPFHIRDMAKSLGLTSTGDFAKMRFWGLIREVEHRAGDEGKKHSGQWVITQNGEDFVNGNYSVCEFIVFYNNKVIDRSHALVDIHGALREKFDYNKLMKGI